MTTKQRCPKCNELNEMNATVCVHCRAPLTQVCPLCGAKRPWYVEHCPYCQESVPDVGLFADLFRDEPRRRLQGRYMLQETLARGRVTAVYRASDADSEKVFAIKELSTVALFRADERREAEAALRRLLSRWAAVSHPSLARLVEWFPSGESFYVVFEFVHGWTLAQIIRGRARVTPELARNWGAQLCALLVTLHRQEPPLYVPFLSPDHVIVQRDGRVKLIGLGLSHLFRPNAPQPFGSVRGYAAPELRSGFPDARSDLFALGRLLYALLIDAPLGHGRPQALPLRKAAPGISPEFVRAIARAAHRDPARRFASAKEMFERLWDEEAYGPLELIEGWQEELLFVPTQPSVEALPRPSSLPRGMPREVMETMAEAGFVRDPRFGPRAEAVPSQAPDLSVPQAEPALSVYPRHLHLLDLRPDEVKRVPLTVRNRGKGELIGRVNSHVEWLSAPRKVMRVPPQKQARVILSLQASQVPTGRAVEPQAISVDTNAGRQWVAVTAEVIAVPTLLVEQAEIDFGRIAHDVPQIAYLKVRNAGRQPLTGQVEARVPWLRVQSGRFRLGGGQDAEIRIELLPDRLPDGAQQVGDALIVDSDGGQTLVAACAWRPRPKLELDVRRIDMGAVAAGQVAERSISLRNTGDGPSEGTARSLLPWLQVSPQTFHLEPGELLSLALRVDCTGLADGPLDVPQALRIQTDDSSETLSLHVEVQAPRLVLETEHLDFGAVPLGEIVDRPLIMRNEGSMPLVVSLQPLVDWLIPAQSDVTIAPGQRVGVPVQLRAGTFNGGQHLEEAAALRLVAGSTLKQIAASLTVLQPSLHVEPEAVDFGYVELVHPEMRTLTIHNAGTGMLAWNIQTDAIWIEVSPQAGVCVAGQSQEVTLTAYGLAIDSPSGSARGTLIINSDGGRAKIPLNIALAAPLIATDTTLLDLGTSVNLASVGRSFRIFNHGLGQLRGALVADQTWIALDRASFVCATGRSVEVHVSLDTEELAPLAHAGESFRVEGVVRIESNSSDEAMSEVHIVAEVRLEPRVEAPEQIELIAEAPGGPFSGRLVLKNTGLAPAHVELRPANSQMLLSRTILDIKPGKSVRVRVQYEGLPTTEGDLSIERLLGGESLRIPVCLVAPRDE
ncbi:MAG: hypothetical protein H5T69_11445 [Chloroflexi bacterium]|nr:hypothetical protein [Chloroflexota bacterium]